MEFPGNGRPNIPEFGSVKTGEGFEALHAMGACPWSKDGTAYPAVLVTTGINDPRGAPVIAAYLPSGVKAAPNGREAANGSGQEPPVSLLLQDSALARRA